MPQDLLSRITALERTVQRYKVLVETSSAIVACAALDEALGAITRVLTERLDVAWANVYDYHASSHQFEVVAYYQIPGLRVDTEGWVGTRFDVYANSSWMTALQERRPVVWYADDPSLEPAEVAERKSWGEFSSITVPLLYREAVMGLLDVGEARALRRYDEDDVRVAQAIADHAAIAIDNARTRALLEQQAITDGLTGLYNHRYLQQRLAQEVAKFERYGRPLSVIMIDIDDFKAFNDTYGHLQGDKLLNELAGVMEGVVRREVDLVARYGGEEFAVLLPDTAARDTNGDAAISVAERLREAVAAHVFEGEDGQRDARVTVSCGVAQLRKGQTAPDLLCCADKALYRAKDAGKDSVLVDAG
jgi:diguanylate cyclase (GGDEF)-like protein